MWLGDRFDSILNVDVDESHHFLVNFNVHDIHNFIVNTFCST